MTPKQQKKIRETYKRYRKTLLQINNDLTFWCGFLNMSVKDYVERNHYRTDYIYDSVFGTYDLKVDGPGGIFTLMNERYTVYLKDLEEWAKEYNGRTVGLNIVLEYNEMEIALLEVTHQLFFPKIQLKNRDRNYYRQIDKRIKRYFKDINIGFDSTNNRHLIEFYKHQSATFKKFLTVGVSDFGISWEDFFEFISILRNSMSHNQGTFTEDGLKFLNLKYEVLLTLLFDITLLDTGHFVVQLKAENQYNFWALINDFVANTIKILCREKTLDFIA